MRRFRTYSELSSSRNLCAPFASTPFRLGGIHSPLSRLDSVVVNKARRLTLMSLQSASVMLHFHV